MNVRSPTNQFDIGVVTVGVFLQAVMEYSASNQTLFKSKRTSDGHTREIVWYNRDSPPPNEPRCGYRGIKQECENGTDQHSNNDRNFYLARNTCEDG